MEIISRSVTDTLKIGRSIAKNLRAGDIICLFGELGSGKTVLTKGIAVGLGIKKSDVISPSFVLIREHRKAKPPLYHFDLYRLKRQADILALGYEEYLYGDGVSVIEWADRLGHLLPQEYLKLELSVKTKTQRLIKFTAFGNRWKNRIR
jgi:tRNA threonylcarbamoyladenosine biosynthesis protein TsaE